MDLDDFPDGVLIAGPDGKVEYVNERIRSMANATGDEMIGMPIDEALPFDDLNGNSWFACTQPYDGLATRTRISEQAWWSPRGSEYLITARLVRDKPGGPVQRVVVSVRNARVRNQRDRERSDLVATVAHELRSPLTVALVAHPGVAHADDDTLHRAARFVPHEPRGDEVFAPPR